MTHAKKRPACLTARGCSLEDVAPDERLNAKVDAFLQVEMLSVSGAYGTMTSRLIAESGLDEESPATILQAKTMLSEYQRYMTEVEQRKSAARGGRPRR